ncbi:2919_t:CDS:2 [Paraglomus brasilianum]|uniref:2919_t:CDS:1 n=1 Tax=Paraglomus brasilianum TaxID=144538 RepID=A0A9N8W1A9_9GLOM|nr:2919_t:CDS:2 [Paraglomus brasilianum]
MPPAKIRRIFSPANEAYPEVNFYVEPPLVKKLSYLLLQGELCLMHGHRQSGKSTVIYAVQRYLHTLTVDMAGFGRTTPGTYIISFDAGIDIDNGVDAFWMSICKKLRVLNPTLFAFDEQLRASYLVGKDPAIINSLLGVGRNKLDAIERQLEEYGPTMRVHGNIKRLPQRSSKVTITHDNAKEVSSLSLIMLRSMGFQDPVAI